MDIKQGKRRIAILGGGPSGLFMFKRLIESGEKDFEIEIFERKGYLGAGMPYSPEGANDEHVTNVSDNEIPVLFSSIEEWVKTAPKDLLERFKINPERFNEYKVLPRLFFGEYLSAQFELLRVNAEKDNIASTVHLHSNITDIADDPENKKVKVMTSETETLYFDCVIICTGHNWPKKYEGKIPGYFDSPYPPKKLAQQFNHVIGIKGSSLTAIDALRTTARYNGTFTEDATGRISFTLNPDSPDFKIVMHSRNGLLPAIRFHLEDSHLGKSGLLSKKDLACHIAENDGFIALDFVFENNFKQMFTDKDPGFYSLIKDMSLEEFVETMMNMREKMEPFDLFRKEYAEAERSIQKRQSIYWKEMLAVLSFAMNYPAKYLSAEDMQRLQKVLMPLISIVIAFVPQSSCLELMALHDAGVLSIVSVGDDSHVEPSNTGGADYYYTEEDGQEVVNHFDTFIDCVGQPHLSYDDFPFKGLLNDGTVSPAKLQFRSASLGRKQMEAEDPLVNKDSKDRYFLQVPGITINDNFQVVNAEGIANNRIYIMAVPYIGGYNPDYSGIDFCEAASEGVVKSVLGEQVNTLLS